MSERLALLLSYFFPDGIILGSSSRPLLRVVPSVSAFLTAEPRLLFSFTARDGGRKHVGAHRADAELTPSFQDIDKFTPDEEPKAFWFAEYAGAIGRGLIRTEVTTDLFEDLRHPLELLDILCPSQLVDGAIELRNLSLSMPCQQTIPICKLAHGRQLIVGCVQDIHEITSDWFFDIPFEC